MIIKELNLIGFGKFKHKSIELKDGLNIIFGENEGGKTTIHSFIDGMFYGFLKPYVKSTIYLDEHKRYNPWDGNRYAGIINFDMFGERYRIERVFTKSREETKVFIETTGEDITYKISTGDKGRVLQPGIHFFGFNNGVYSNTISIKQLGTKTDDKLANEVRDKLVNITSTLDDEISIEDSIKYLDKSLKETGSLKAPTSKYGITIESIDRLKAKKEEILKFKEEYEQLLDENIESSNKLGILHHQLESEKEVLGIALYFDRLNLYNEALEINEIISKLEHKLNEYSSFNDLSNDDYSNILNLSNEIIIITNKLEDLNIQVNETQTLIKDTLNNKDDFDIERANEISRDFMEYDSLEDEKNRLIYGNDKSEIEFLKRDFKSKIESKSRLGIAISLVSVFYLLLTYFTIRDILWPLFFLNQLFIILIIIIIRKLKQINVFLSHSREKLFDLEHEKHLKESRLEDIESRRETILNKYAILSKVELRSFYDDMQKSRIKRDSQINQVENNNKRIDALNNRTRELITNRQKLELNLEKLLSNNGVNSIKEFEAGLKYKNIYQDALIEHRNKKELMKRILGESSLAELKIQLEPIKNVSENSTEPKEVIQGKISSLIDCISSCKLNKKGIEERISFLMPEISKLVEIEEEISRNLTILENLDRKRESLELAKSTIDKLSKEIQNQFAPEINIKIGEIINKITRGKYSGVRIDNKLNIGVINPISGEIIDVDALSGGTIDQLYFSLRFGIINSITNDSMPLILDDCFIQYDDNRLESILQFLSEISKDRQVILFTCHNREKNILDNLNVDFNLITLT